jgi:hypothetical protein
MFIVRIYEGLGNQMFQYAFYRRLLADGKDAYMDISAYEKHFAHYGYELSKVFNIRERLATRAQIKKVRRSLNEMNIFQRIYRRTKLLLRYPYVHYKENSLSPSKNQYKFDPSVLKLRGPRYLDGNWMFYKYFENIEHILRKEFVFKNIEDSRNRQMASKIKSSKAVSIHIRRGDFVANPFWGNIWGKICDLNYYQKAIQLIKGKVKNPVFFVFSDDLDWCIKHLPIVNAQFVDFNRGENSYKDMYLMSLCRLNIIANSSFSWWAAWLNENPGKIVIAPNRWIKPYDIDRKNFFPPKWLTIEV